MGGGGAGYAVQRKMAIIGVMKDFLYGTVDTAIGPLAFLPWKHKDQAILNAETQSVVLQ